MKTGRLEGEIDGLVGMDPDSLDDAELGETVVELQRQRARLAAVSHRLTAALDARRVWADDGSRSAAGWLAHRCHLPLGQARGEVRLGRRLRSMPATAEAFAAGEITERHAALLGSLNTGRTAAQFAGHEAMLVDQARTLSWPDFCRAVDYWRQLADPDGPEDDAKGDQARRRVHLSPGLRGSGILDGQLTALGRTVLAGGVGAHRTRTVRRRLGRRPAEHGDAATSAPGAYAGPAPPRRPGRAGQAGHDRPRRRQTTPTVDQRARRL
ncbi:MAG: DUF222 domain-containing protein [Acidimicrobiales bacterium]